MIDIVPQRRQGPSQTMRPGARRPARSVIFGRAAQLLRHKDAGVPARGDALVTIFDLF